MRSLGDFEFQKLAESASLARFFGETHEKRVQSIEKIKHESKKLALRAGLAFGVSVFLGFTAFLISLGINLGWSI